MVAAGHNLTNVVHLWSSLFQLFVAVCTFLKTMLANEIHPHPLILMRGVDYHVLEGFIDFIYSGETKLEQEHVNSFQKLCMEM